MKRPVALGAALAAASFASVAAELYSPALPASVGQSLECRIVNVSGAAQTVAVEAFDSNGATIGGPSVQALAPGQAGGFALPGFHAGMYCKFTVKGSGSGFRASIDVVESTATGFRIVVALPAQ